MSITQQKNTFVDDAAVSIGLSQLFSVTAGANDPAYLVLTALDRNEYTAGSSGATGSFTGNGHTGNFSNIGGDGRGAGIVFAYQASGRYYNSTYGYLDQLTYNSSGSANDVTNLSLFGASTLSQTANAGNAYAMMQSDTSGYLGSATIVTQAAYTATVPAQATPDSIATIADGFVGKAWNMNGCWVLASTIAADAGASLPVQSTAIGLSGQTNGEWFAAFNGPAGQAGNWQSMVTVGDIVVIGTPGGGGHITTCVAGSGSTAMLVDNITYESANGQIQNAAHDGSSSDIIVSAAHLASQEWSGVAASSVVIYQLDTPVVSLKLATDSLQFLKTQALTTLFAATDPENKAIADWQVYDTASSDSLVVGGVADADHSAATALTAASLNGISLLAGSMATTDTLEVRASNGTYWGDWQSLSVAIAGTAQATPTPPVVATQTTNQTWLGGKAVSLALPAATFHDPLGQSLSYAAHLANGQALPSWLTFNATTDTFSGTAPTTTASLTLAVTATDTGGLSVTDSFSAVVVGAPLVTAQTAAQTWAAGAAFSLTLPANTFTDPQNQPMAFTATQANGQALPTWLKFNAATDTFSGAAPATAQTLSIKLTATDTSGLAASEAFNAAVQPTAIAVKATPSQVWTPGQSVDLVLPPATFTDALGLRMSFAAYQVAGPNITSWLRFNPATATFTGSDPTSSSGTVGLEVIATDANHVSATDMFTVSFAPAANHTTTAGALSFAAALTPSPQPLGGLILHS